MGDDVLDRRPYRRLAGIGARDMLRHRPSGRLRRWIRLTSIFAAELFFPCDR